MRQRHSRLNSAGSTHFVTTVTSVPGNWFVGAPTCRAFLDTFESYRAKFELSCLGYVLMPDHLHALLFQDRDGPAVSQLMQAFKSVTAHICRPLNYPLPSLWNDGYDDVPIPGPSAARTRLRYMHRNPVKRGLVAKPEIFEWSSARFFFCDEPGIVTVVRLSPL
jgi:putative transposase